MTTKQKKDAAAVFRALGNMLLSGVPLLQAIDGVAADTADKSLKGELKRIKSIFVRREAAEKAWTFLPQSVQLIWRAGQQKDLERYCLRIAEILGS